MKKLLFTILFIPSFVLAETWHCNYKSTEGPASDSESFMRAGKYFVSEKKFTDGLNQYLIAKEEGNSIILVFQGTSNYVVHLRGNKEIGGNINYIALSDMAQWKGNCRIE